jgi:hypothetical protein
MKTSETLKEIMPSLLAAQALIKNLAPNKQGYGYKYVDLAKILDETKHILIGADLLIIQSVTTAENGVGITTRLQHKSGEYMEDTFTLPAVNQKSMNDVQGLGASITYGRRYGISCFLGIATDEDIDANMQEKPKPQPDFNRIDAIKKIDALMDKLGCTDEYIHDIQQQYSKAKSREDFKALYQSVEGEN